MAQEMVVLEALDPQASIGFGVAIIGAADPQANETLAEASVLAEVRGNPPETFCK